MVYSGRSSCSCSYSIIYEVMYVRVLPVDIAAHPVSVLILRPREAQALRSQNYDT